MTAASGIVMVVDDDLAVRESLKFALEIEGLQVAACGSGAELLEHPELPHAGCLVLDYRMPAMDGLEVMERLACRKMRLPVILITSHATTALCQRAAAAGVRCILEKPLLGNALINGIRDVLSQAN